ncbi:MAG: 16S rRNA (guanine(966)-N(2))-methyltransferase RsmD [Bryobacterales bacterium]|nr:16S rRNA (guanine(966)-N(2))-methyltransferase RsmD [Bryobacterales bacterium]
MRIIAGEFKSRRLKSIPGLDTRPTPDRMRESLFSAIQPELDGAVFADLYAGTGCVGLEALSRGASSVIFVERHAKALKVLRENIASLGAETRTRLMSEAASRAALYLRAHIVFLDPPYELGSEYESCLEALGEGSASLVLVQHETRRKLAAKYGHLTQDRMIKQGSNAVTFYRTETSPVGHRREHERTE